MTEATTADVKKHATVREEVMNCIDNQLMHDEIEIDRYETLVNFANLMDDEGCVDLGGGYRFKLQDMLAN